MATLNFIVVYDAATGQELRHIKNATDLKHHIGKGESYFQIQPATYDSFQSPEDLKAHTTTRLIELHPELSEKLAPADKPAADVMANG